MTTFVDTSVWSLALRRDAPPSSPEVGHLAELIRDDQDLLTTGLVLQELLQGFAGPRAREQIQDRFEALPMIVPERQDHVEAADLRNMCRRRGVQIGTIDALLAQLCIRRELVMLTTDQDFRQMARHCALSVWQR